MKKGNNYRGRRDTCQSVGSRTGQSDRKNGIGDPDSSPSRFCYLLFLVSPTHPLSLSLSLIKVPKFLGFLRSFQKPYRPPEISPLFFFSGMFPSLSSVSLTIYYNLFGCRETEDARSNSDFILPGTKELVQCRVFFFNCFDEKFTSIKFNSSISRVTIFSLVF